MRFSFLFTLFSFIFSLHFIVYLPSIFLFFFYLLNFLLALIFSSLSRLFPLTDIFSFQSYFLFSTSYTITFYLSSSLSIFPFPSLSCSFEFSVYFLHLPSHHHSFLPNLSPSITTRSSSSPSLPSHSLPIFILFFYIFPVSLIYHENSYIFLSFLSPPPHRPLPFHFLLSNFPLLPIYIYHFLPFLTLLSPPLSRRPPFSFLLISC